MHQYDNNINLPTLPNEVQPTRRLCGLYGYEKTHSARELVNYVSESFPLPRHDISFLTISVDQFPINDRQLRQYYESPTWIASGYMRARSRHEPSNDPQPRRVHNPDKDLEYRNMVVGAEVGTDSYGPVANKCAILFRDQTGFQKSTFHLWSVRMQSDSVMSSVMKDNHIAKAIEWCILYYRSHGHHIELLKSDSHVAYKSELVKNLCLKYNIKQRLSPAGVHSHNGLAEVTNKNTANIVTSMFALAPYMPKQHWTRTWELAEVIQNFKCSMVPGDNISRWEAFFRERPDYRRIPIHPYGQPIQCLVPLERRSGDFPKHDVILVYVGPDLQSPGCILGYNFDTKRVSYIYTYKILERAQRPYNWHPLDPAMRRPRDPRRGPGDYSMISSPHPNDITTVIDIETPNQTTTVPTPTTMTVPIEMSMSDAPSPRARRRRKNKSRPTIIPSAASATDVPVPTQTVTDVAEVITSEGAQVTDAVTASEGEIVVTADAPTTEGASNSEGGTIPVAAVPDMTTLPADVLSIEVVPAETIVPLATDPPVIPSRYPRRSSANYDSGRFSKKVRHAHAAEGESGEYPVGVVLEQRDMEKRKYYSEGKVDIEVNDDELSTMVELLDDNGEVTMSSGMRVQIIRDQFDENQSATVYRSINGAKKIKQRTFDNPTYTQAQKREDWPLWKEAIDSEINQLYDEGVFDRDQYLHYKDLPAGSEILGTMFTLVIKRNPSTGTVDKYKARLVVLGNQQTENSYDEIKSMTARGSSAKLVMTIQKKTDAYSMVLDVKGAYLKSDIKDLNKEKIHLKLPDGRIVQLKKYMYGLKQAGREWQINLTKTLTNAGFTNSTADPLVFSKWKGNSFIQMAVHVDDLYVISSTPIGLDHVYDVLIKAYNDVTRKEGDLLTYLGLAISHDRHTGSVTISQPAYIEKMLILGGFNESNSIPTPMAIDQSCNERYSHVKVDKTNYLRLVGLINYLASYSRPDLLYSLSRIAQACSDPSEADMRR
eukprot:gene34358-44379_t